MHVCWDFDVQFRALDKHQIEAKVHYLVTILEHKVNTQLLI